MKESYKQKSKLLFLLARIKWFFFPNSRTQRKTFSPEFNSFVIRNTLLWKTFFSGVHLNKKDTILISALYAYNTQWLLSRGMVGAILCKILKASPIALLDQFDYDQTATAIKSFQITDIAFLRTTQFNLGSRIKTLFNAIYLLFITKTPEQLLDLHFKGIKIGDLVYDRYISRTGNGGIRKIDFSIITDFCKVLFFIHRLEKIFSRHRIKYVVIDMEERFGLAGAIFRYALYKKAEVFMVFSVQSKIGLTRYNSMEQAFLNPRSTKPSLELVNYFRKNEALKKYALEQYEKKIQEEISPQKFDSLFVHPSHDPARKSVDKKTLVEEYKLDPGLPIALISCHVFIDAPHGQGFFVFNDFLEWYQETLKFIKKVKNVNWLIKPHPGTNFYDYHTLAKQTAEQEFKNIIDSEDNHIHILPDNIRTVSLLQIADLVVSCLGTISVEANALGIPTIMAGNGPNTGFGYSKQPYTREEYFEMLTHAAKMKKLSLEETEIARIVYFLFRDHLYHETYFVPLVKKKERGTEMFWNIVNYNLSQIMSIEETDLCRNVNTFVSKEHFQMIDYEMISKIVPH